MSLNTFNKPFGRRRTLALGGSALLGGIAMATLPTPARAAISSTPLAGDGDDAIGRNEVYAAAYEDTLHEIARRFDFGYVEMRAANPNVDPYVPGQGTRVFLPGLHLLPDAPRRGVVINLAELRLYWFPDDGPAETHPIGIGREGFSTPVGSTSIVNKRENPTWTPTASMRERDPSLPVQVPPGPENPLGTRALYLGWPAYLIHGTNRPLGVGRRVSSGCIRLYPEDIEALYPKVPVGAQVTVVDQAVKFGWVSGELFVEVSPGQDFADEMAAVGTVDATLPDSVIGKAHEIAAAGGRSISLPTLLQAALDRTGVPVRITG